MENLFSQEFKWLWTVALGLALFYPVRQLIWVASVRRAERRDGPADEARQHSLKRRAAVTSFLMSFIFSVFYVGYLFKGPQ